MTDVNLECVDTNQPIIRTENNTFPKTSNIDIPTTLPGITLGLVTDEPQQPAFILPHLPSVNNDPGISDSESIINLPMTAEEQASPLYRLPSQADILLVLNKLEEFAGTVYHLLEKQSEEIKDIKAHLNAFRAGGSGVVPDFSSIPTLPIFNSTKLDEVEDWLNLDANKHLLVP
ncbi:unnamed protein product [Orchesella dallaii]|uniref:Uncharacterized protein n=1 Tax=Orchesella dallaii TaxID=48710 RepID=A0ABP1S799_9HEXA